MTLAAAPARPEIVVATDAHEGPVHVAAEDALYFTTVPRPGDEGPRVDIRRLALDGRRLSTVRCDANAANGMALAADGRLLVCEQGSRTRPAAITLVDRATGETEVLADRRGGVPLNSPNDVVAGPDGAVWFTDPGYGHLQGFRPAPRAGDDVLRIDPRSGGVTIAADGFDKPNGLAFSPDGGTLYVADSGATEVVAFDAGADGALSGRRPFAAAIPRYPDGLAVGDDGRVYIATGRGVQVHDPSGAPIGEIPVPGGAVNLTFGGPGRDVLLITADDAIWAASLDAPSTRP